MNEIDETINLHGDFYIGEGICERCGTSINVTFGPDPYALEINDDDTPVWECANCRDESAGDI